MLWGQAVGTDAEKDICGLAMRLGLRCLSGSTNMEGLMRLDRPFLCQLKKGDLSELTLVKKMRADQLLVEHGEKEYWVEKENFTDQWRGDFVLLWRPPAGGALIGPGSSGEVVTWLRERLSLADAEPVAEFAGIDRFDAGLKFRLERFQKAHGLMADGLAGAWTMILLNNQLPAAGTPTLMDEA